MRRLAFALALLFIFIGYVKGQAPEKISYQAVVRHTNGTIIAESLISLRISLRKGGVDGMSSYSEIHSVRTNEFGLVNFGIGGGSSTDDFSAIDWSGSEQFWIRIEIDENGGNDFELMGGMELLSVPFSLYASKAGSAQPILQSMTDAERQLIDNPVPGLMILNSTSNKVNVFKTDGWYELGEEKILESFSCGKQLIDSRDSIAYKTIRIGEKCWMAENLNVGEMIEGGVEMTDNGEIEKYCYQNSSASCDVYGALYQWDELMLYSKVKSSQGICPDGWHIPSDLEVQALEISLGMDSEVASLSNTWRGTDQGTQMGMGGASGFDALYSGRRVTGGLYSALSSYEYLWTSSESGSDAWRRCFRADDPKIGRYNTFPKTYGMSVRCVQN